MFEKKGNFSGADNKHVLSFAHHIMILRIEFNFKVVKMEILGPSCGHLNFAKCRENTFRSLKFEGSAATYVQSYSFSQMFEDNLKHYFSTLTAVSIYPLQNLMCTLHIHIACIACTAVDQIHVNVNLLN